jgi:hypothetical protein
LAAKSPCQREREIIERKREFKTQKREFMGITNPSLPHGTLAIFRVLPQRPDAIGASDGLAAIVAEQPLRRAHAVTADDTGAAARPGAARGVKRAMVEGPSSATINCANCCRSLHLQRIYSKIPPIG